MEILRKIALLFFVVSSFCVATGLAHAGQVQFLDIDGSVSGNWDTPYFPDQSFDVPIDGQLLVSPIDSKRVRITGNYHYAATVESVCFVFLCPDSLLVPYPFEVDASIDVIATVNVQRGRTVYRAPRGTVVEEVWMDVFKTSYSMSYRKTLPDIVVSSAHWGIGGSWFSDGPLVFEVDGGQTELFFGGDL